jgi:hypothetical protein
MQRPVSAFITFETEEGHARAEHYNHVCSTPQFGKFDTLMGHKIHIEPASEPSDIIWENRHYTDYDRSVKKFFSVIVITLALIFSFVVIFWFAKYALQLKSKYPMTDCVRINKDYLQKWDLYK